MDVDKGDEVDPEYRSRLVAKEFKTGKREDLCAATPPLEANRMLFSIAATRGLGRRAGNDKFKIDFLDGRRTYFHAEAVREVYVQLPEED